MKKVLLALLIFTFNSWADVKGKDDGDGVPELEVAVRQDHYYCSGEPDVKYVIIPEDKVCGLIPDVDDFYGQGVLIVNGIAVEDPVLKDQFKQALRAREAADQQEHNDCALLLSRIDTAADVPALRGIIKCLMRKI